MAEVSIALTDVAETLGVHYMTAYRYVRTGALHATQVDGRWVVAESELARFQRRPPAARGRRPATGLTPPSGARIDQLLDRLIVGDEAGSWSILADLQGSGWQRTDIVSRILTPVLREIGDRWEAGTVSIAQEHVASGVTQRLLARLAASNRQRGRRGGTAVLAAVGGERHGLPLALAADVLRDNGLHVVDLGADTPADEIRRAAVAQDRLVGVGICATVPLDTSGREAVRRAADGVRADTGRPVLVGGAAVPSLDAARRLGADDWSATLDDVVAWFRVRAAEIRGGRDRDD